MTVLAFERHPVDPNAVGTFEKLVGELVHRMRDASGALWADAAKAFDDDPSYVVLSEWRTIADLDAWEAGDDVHRFLDDADVFLRGEITRRRFSSD